MNTTRPKSLLRKRENKHRSVARKIAIIEERRLAMKALLKGKKVEAVKEISKPEPAKKTAVAKKTPVKKTSTVKKPRATKKAA